ncbi:hypothetical protein ABGB18_02325 [Nonomuraea sp. B12E4]|uniref:hypothetical protein n=1 Tax=Nonomuraea sp. B12E4 TaxID=3153564 RepID=UPI00325F2C86
MSPPHPLLAAAGEAAGGRPDQDPSRTGTFLGERYRRIAKRRGRLRAVVAVGRSIMVIIWHLLSYLPARCHDLGADYFLTKIDGEKEARAATPTGPGPPQRVGGHRPWRGRGRT